MTESKKPNADGNSWNWVYLIPIMALMIPIVATTNLDITEVLTSTMATDIATLGAGTVAGRYLLGYRPQREITALESQQLT